MSTKVYNAYRLKENVDLWDFLHDVRVQAVSIIQTKLREFYDLIKEHPEYLEITEENPTYCDISDAVRDKYGEQLSRLERNPYNLDVSLSVRRFENRYYIRAFSDKIAIFGDPLTFLRDDERLENYEYWNNTDRPEDVSDEDWKERERCWNELDKKRFDSLILDIVAYHNFHQVDFWMWNDFQFTKKEK